MSRFMSSKISVNALSTQVASMFVTLGLSLLLIAQSPAGETSEQSKAKPVPDYGIKQVAAINKGISQVWSDYQISPSELATDGEWCRRLFLDVVGRIPTVKERKEFLDDSSPDKKMKLVDKLLFDDLYTEEYARNWTTLWTNILIGRSGGSERRSLTDRTGMQKYLRDTFARNKPYDRMVHDLVTATGSNKPGTDGFNGAVNFLSMKVNEEKAGQATAATSRIFLGLQVQCTQCHNHPFNEWKQQKYWEMNAFFRQTRSLRRYLPGTREIDSVELVNEDFGGEGSTPEEAELYYELRNGRMVVAYPVFLDGQEIERSGYLDEVDRRTALGKFVINSPFLEKMIVNRMWAHFLGYGFTKPINDLGSHNAPSHPQLIEYLGSEFREIGFDMKELIRWITLSQAYSLSSRTNSSNELDDPLLGESPRFSHFYLRQMRAEELYESLITATEAQKTRGTYEQQEQIKAAWLRQFIVAFGTDEGDETTTFNGTIPQALMMFNGDLIKKATSPEKGSFIWQIANSKLKPDDKIDYLYLAALSRTPTKAEISIANELLKSRRADASAAYRDAKKNGKPKGKKANATAGNGIAEAMRDIWWAILNSNEFIFNH